MEIQTTWKATTQSVLKQKIERKEQIKDLLFSYYNYTENYGKYKKKKVGVAGLQPTLISLDYSKL